MYLSEHRLHSTIFKTKELKAAGEAAVEAVIVRRRGAVYLSGAPKDSYTIPLTTVSANRGFDATIAISLRGAIGPPIGMIVDTGNACLIVPDFAAVTAIPNWNALYTVLAVDREPWGCPAKLVQGPIDIAARDGSVFSMDDCIFWACTGPNQDGNRTANFGAGCLTRWWTYKGAALMPAQAWNHAFPFAEFNFAPAETVLSFLPEIKVSSASSLVVSQHRPAGYTMFDILDVDWMALSPKSLSIGATRTSWPNASRSPIAMIDTGGTCAYLVDPDAYLLNRLWPPIETNPDWTKAAWRCETTSNIISVELGDAHGSVTYTLDTSHMPAPVRGQTLVICQTNDFMRNNYGMNIGGISALAVSILVDYGSRRVGLKLK